MKARRSHPSDEPTPASIRRRRGVLDMIRGMKREGVTVLL